jgi:hypothetical protein
LNWAGYSPAEAPDDLGERDAGIKLVQDWMCSEHGRPKLEDAQNVN